MLTFLVKFVKILLTLFMTVNSVFGIFTGDKEAKIARAEENCQASFAVISDTHLKANFIRQGMFELGLKDMADAKDKLDAFVITGDVTDHGYDEMWETFGDAMSKYDVASQKIIVIGNHDTWGHEREDGTDDPDAVRESFIKYSKQISDRDIENVYYSTNINGYPVIVLGSEGCNTSATVSQTQLDWFAQEMEKASQTGLPIFVFFHQSINQTHGLPYTWEMNEDDPPERGGIGDASDAVLAIIQKYNNVFYISGHIHGGLSTEEDDNAYNSIERFDGYTLINVPCYMYPNVKRGGCITNGTGYVFEIYNDKVLLRARNFATGTWCTKYDLEVDLVEETVIPQ